MAGRKNSGSNSRLYPIFVAAFLAAALGIGYADPFFLKALRFIGFDELQRLNPGGSDAAGAVQVVDIDEASLAKIGQWPWPRSKLAELVDGLREAGAAAIAFDVMFAEPDRSSLEQVVASLPPDQAAILAPLSKSWISNDDRFTAAVAKAPIILGVTLTQTGQAAGAFPAKAGLAVAGDDPRPFLKSYGGFIGNLPGLTQAAAGAGAINWVPDRDQVVRRVPLVFRVGDTLAPSLAAEALRVAQGAGTYVVKASNASGEDTFGRPSGVNHIRIGRYEIPTDADGGVWLRYHKVDTASFVPAWRVLSGALDKSEIKGRIVLIGTSAAGLSDLRATPLQEAVPGVAVHQQIIEHILGGHPLTRPDYAPALELGVILILGTILAALFPFLPAQASAIAGAIAIGGVNVAAWWFFVQKGLLFDPLYPSLCLFLLGASASVYLYRRTEVQRQEIRRAFGRYVSPAVVQELISHPEKLSLGGEVRPLTLLFCDVRGFTKISEGLNAEQLTRFINNLLTPLSEIVIAHGGTIDKYMGDAIMAFWNAPLDDPKHARHALDAAAAILAELGKLNAQWRKEAASAGRPHRLVQLGIGLNTGECCVGNLGSSIRFDYSAIGDDVNVASRFEGLTKLYSVPLVTGEQTQSEAPDLPFLELDLARVKGRERPSRIYTLLTAFEIPKSRYAEIQSAHTTMLAAYRKMDWTAAETTLQSCRALNLRELDGLHDLFTARIAAFRLAPPPADWDGVFTALEK
jgi:adenylate cyclase